MIEETNDEQVQLTDKEAQERIAAMFNALDAVYNLHAPDQTEEVWICPECNGAEWPCKTEKIVLGSLGL